MSVAFKNLHQSKVSEFAKQMGSELLSHTGVAKVIKNYTNNK